MCMGRIGHNLHRSAGSTEQRLDVQRVAAAEDARRPTSGVLRAGSRGLVLLLLLLVRQIGRGQRREVGLVHQIVVAIVDNVQLDAFLLHDGVDGVVALIRGRHDCVLVW